MKRLDLTGHIIGRLRVIEALPSGNTGVRWRCECACGNEVIQPATILARGIVRSCGCLRSDERRARNLTHGGAAGEKKPRLYRIWKGMRGRCSNPSVDSYRRYGGRGIKVCAEWADYAVFREWAERNGYRDGLTIDRADNDGDYTPGNCQWTTQRVQSKNTRRNVTVTLGGEQMILSDALERVGMTHTTYSRRRRAGLSEEAALTAPRIKGRRLTSP